MMFSGAVGVGIDLVDVARIALVRKRHGEPFLKRVFLPEELEYCLKFSHPDAHLAARFAAKEAMVKALGTGFSGDIGMLSVGVGHAENNAPVALLDAAAKRRLSEIGASKILISISHLKDYAQAMAVAVK